MESKIYTTLKSFTHFLTYTVFTFLFFSHISFPQWRVLRQGNSTQLNSIDFSTPLHGYIAGNGKILKTIDGGKYWANIKDGWNAKVIDFITRDKGVVVVDNNIYYTENGGAWQIAYIVNHSNNSINDIQVFRITESGWAVGNNGRIYKTLDLSTFAFWQEIATGIFENFNSLYFISSQKGWVIGTNGIMLNTTDGGSSWTTQYLGINNLTDIVFINDSVGYIIASGGRIYKTNDFGSNWSYQEFPNFQFKKIQFISDNVGYITTIQGMILKTTDNGDTWLSYSTGSADDVNDLYFFDENKGIIVGNNSFIAGTENGGITSSWSIIKPGDENNLNSVDSKNGWTAVAGNNGTVLFITPNFRNEIYPSRANLNSITVGNSNNTIAVGDSGTILKLNIYTGELINSGVSENLNSIFLYSQPFNFGWIVGDKGTLLKTTDWGSNWVKQNFNSNLDLLDIFFTDNLKGWISCSGGVLYKTTDGGDNWEFSDSLGTHNLNKIFFPFGSFGYIAADSGFTYITTDGGNNWSTTWVGIYSNITSVSSYDIFDPMICTFDGRIYKSSNFGNNWSLVVELNGMPLNDIHLFVTDNHRDGLAIGGDGLILYLPTVVPVELVSFTGYQQHGKVFLEWSTASELNNQGFEIQRKDLSNTDANWIPIGFIQGHGTTLNSTLYSFEDNLEGLGLKDLSYRLKQIDFTGNYILSNEILIKSLGASKFQLGQNYPNPFNANTTISFSIPVKCSVKLLIYDILGNEITTLLNEEKEAGYYNLIFDANELSSGIYIYKFIANDFIDTQKMILLK